jgi:hypothetical protein
MAREIIVTGAVVSRRVDRRRDVRDVSSMKEASENGGQACSRCGAMFRCANDAQCWCKALPHLSADRLDPLMGCLCPDCLRMRTDEAKSAGSL